MRTSTIIKQGQYKPIQGKRTGNRWTFESESRDRVSYTTERNGREYKCGCPARGLCKHITSAVVEDARANCLVKVQVWTDPQDARRQHRRTIELTANGIPFWVTYDYPADVDRSPGRLTGLTRDIFGNVDAWYIRGGLTFRRLYRRAA